MSCIHEIFMRADIQRIREFLLHGVDGDPDQRSYQERTKDAQMHVITNLRKQYQDEHEFEEITGLLYQYAGTIEAVYMEIGIQVGAILVTQISQNIIASRKE